ncbi:DUF1254 domain-containing protein [Tomitella fengzijianii]|uniref:DUF1254 domain-containing protein n=1 Tax=Tomitella fengzijianii TaxID=2597660 RepID=A0A516X5V7_9ACTN|nr:DUF1254 domain-containing protein [Tomitella fengzijianii]QDQ98426.1 DUF1254 domain-containing protein [Tomitella fengzijianii]
MPAPQHPATMTAEAAADALEDAYIYAYPLVLMDVIREMTTNTELPTTERAPLGQFFHSRALASPAIDSLTRPNADTLYSQAYLDLGDEPYLLHKPAAQRYLAIQPFDGYSNNPSILGTGGPGGDDEAVYAFTGPRFRGTLPEGVIPVPMPTDFVWLLARVRCHGPDDIAEPHRLQDAMDLYPLSQHGRAHEYPRGAYSPARDFVPLEHILTLDAEAYFRRFNALAATNPGTADDRPALEKFAQVGVGAGLDFSVSALPEAAQRRAKELPGLMDSPRIDALRRATVVDGWTYLDPSVGRFGTDYTYRARIAHRGFANPVDVTAYPSIFADADGAPLTGEHSYVMHFPAGQHPPYHEGGWWSLAPYTQAGRLVANELDRYALDDGMPLTINPDGSLDLWLSADAPDAERMPNWLPVGREGFGLTMRIYLPHHSVTTHEWTPPQVRRVEARQ